MIDLKKVVDTYERRARLYPGLLCVSPLLIYLLSVFPAACNRLSMLLAVLFSIGLLQLMAHLARDRGKMLESKLFVLWGGIPSVYLLRHRDRGLNVEAKKNYHATLANRSEIRGPTEQEEVENPEAADSIYSSWSDFLRSKTRDSKRYNLLFEENVNYGFRRNLLGLKPFSLFFAVIGIAGCIWDAYVVFQNSNSMITVDKILVLITETIFLLIVLFVVNPDWVRVPAEAYAKRLLEALNG